MKKGFGFCMAFSALLAAGNGTDPLKGDNSLDDPILLELQKIKRQESEEKKAQKVPETELLPHLSSGHLLQAPHLSPELSDLKTTLDEERSYDPHPVQWPAEPYLRLKEIPLLPPEPVDPERYLSLKKILLPMPQDYAKTYLKMKTLLNPTQTYVQIHIDKSRQRMWVYLDNDYVGDWKVSTARRGYWTPNGVFRPYSLERMHYSKKYHHSPMPWSVFFKGGYAIHGTYSIRHLGHPASHGCVRVHPRNAKKLYRLIQRYGKRYTRIIIRG